MSPDRPRSSARRWAALVILVLAAALLIATCQRRPRPRPGEPAPLPPKSLRAGFDAGSGRDVDPVDAAGLITVRERATGATVQIRATAFSREAIDQAFAEQVQTQRIAGPPAAVPGAPISPAAAPRAPAAAEPKPPASLAGKPSAPAAASATSASPLPLTAATLPPFLPVYPGGTTLKLSAVRESGGLRGLYEFSTPDLPEAIGSFYAKTMTAAGVLVVVNVAGANAQGPTATVVAENADSSRSMSLTAGRESSQSHGSIEFLAK